ncbi:MAG: hypothetical protein ACRD4M_08875 [Candidatus Acidiferrales bacterium]
MQDDGDESCFKKARRAEVLSGQDCVGVDEVTPAGVKIQAAG